MPKKDEQNDRLEELINKLDDRLSIFNKDELKQKVIPLLKGIQTHIDSLNDLFSQVAYLLNVEYQDLH